MCAPVTHLLLAQQIRRKYFADSLALPYYSGTLFPDIRHYVGLGKSITHDLNKKISSLISMSDWYKGFWVHSIVDQVHQTYMVPKDPSSLSPKPRYMAYVLLEDQVFYPEAHNIVDSNAYKITYFTEEDDFGISALQLREYKSFVTDYLSVSPNYARQIRFLKETVPEVSAPGYIEAMEEYFNGINNEKVVNDIYSLRTNFLSEVDKKV